MKAYAKINLALDIIGKRPDGYHDLITVMQQIDLADEITLSRRTDGVKICCNAAGVPTDERNIVWKAALAYSRFTGIDVKEICFTIKKNIPDGAGLGGGSSDGAAALRLLDEYFATNLSSAQKTEIAASVGADVPFFLYGGTALCEGIGERITPLHSLSGQILLIKPWFSISTPRAFETYDATPTVSHPNIDVLCAAIAAGDLRQTAALGGNVLQSCAEAQFPLIGEIVEYLLAQGAFGAQMTGSGSAVYGIFANGAAADAAARNVSFPDVSVYRCSFC